MFLLDLEERVNNTERLLLACIAGSIDKEQKEKITFCAKKNISWPLFLRLTLQEKLSYLVYNNIKDIAQDLNSFRETSPVFINSIFHPIQQS